MKKENAMIRSEFLKYMTGGMAGMSLAGKPFQALDSMFGSADSDMDSGSDSGSESGSEVSSGGSEKGAHLNSLRTASDVEPNMIGAYGPWADKMYGDLPGDLSFRNRRWRDVDRWKKEAHDRLIELLASPDTGGVPEVTVHSTHHYEGLIIEKLSWQLPYGPPTEAYFLKPEGATEPLPGVVALHDHGGNKYFGKRKIAQYSDEIHPMLEPFQEYYYGGRSWANALAKRGFAVLVPDAFAFASRRVLIRDVSDRIKRDYVDVSPEETEEEIRSYNNFASNSHHENIMAKSLFCAGMTWPGVFVAEDQKALDILAARSDVDESRLGCCGLSGGGLRSVMLSGVDPRIKSAVCVGMMSTWRDFLMYHCFTHTWMIYVPHLARHMDYSEIFSLNMPSSRLVLQNSEDGIFDYDEQQRSDRILTEVYQKAGLSDHYRCEFHPGGHKFDLDMQESAFSWFEQWLGGRAS